LLYENGVLLMAEKKLALKLENITKSYPGVVALNHVTLELVEGEIHALVGENGAGKSTLIKTCAGAEIPDSGKIIVEGNEFSAMTPKFAENCGIEVIYQEFNLVEELSVAENIFLGSEIKKGFIIDKKAMVESSRKLLQELNISIDPNALIKDLTVGYQQMVEIAKAFSKNAKILIMDEPSAPLTNAEVERMFELVDKLKAKGVSIIYISHRLEEIFRLSDRITVLRDGKEIKTMDTSSTNIDELVKLMVGRELEETFPSRKNTIREETLLEANNLCGNGLRDVSFVLKRGEILGFAGLIGAGRTELAELIFGAKKKTSGQIFFKGKEISPQSPKDAINYGIALVPEDRKRQGAVLPMAIRENISMASLEKLSRFFMIHKDEEKLIANTFKDSLQIKTPSMEQAVNNLSGGNQQKVVLAKWLATNPDLIILDEPTRGIDVGAKHEIYKIMNDLVESGKTIIMISSEMPELMGMTDRIIVLAEGKMTGEVMRNEFDQELIMSYASKNGSKTFKNGDLL
jgi:ribose transport system ATP-binding protein